MTTEHRPDDSEQKLEKLENLEAAVNHLQIGRAHV